MRMISLASGSSGNTTLVISGKEVILVDCGISAKRLKESLAGLGLSLYDISAVLLTREHNDHIKGLKRLISAYDVPVYGSRGTIGSLYSVTGDEFFRFGASGNYHYVDADKEYSIGSITFLPFSIFHDAAEPFGYRIETDQTESSKRKHVSVGIMTDCGHVDDYIVSRMKGVNAALIESNHDRGMLANGPYPMPLKRRIMSLNGHMSNDSTGSFIGEILDPSFTDMLLGHLSKENNTSELALKTVKERIDRIHGKGAADGLSIGIALQNEISGTIVL